MAGGRSYYENRKCMGKIHENTTGRSRCFKQSISCIFKSRKTERECVKQIVERAKEAGYKELSELIKEGKTCKPGDKVYAVNMEKAVILFQVGSEPLENGMNILGAHIDSPRLDVKQNPLYEDGDFAFLDTHYYGGIKNISG